MAQVTEQAATGRGIKASSLGVWGSNPDLKTPPAASWRDFFRRRARDRGLEASPVGLTALQACKRPSRVAFSSAAWRYLVEALSLLNGDARKSERKEGSLRPPLRCSKRPTLRYRKQDIRIIIAAAVHPGTDGATLEGALMGLPRQLEQRRQALESCPGVPL